MDFKKVRNGVKSALLPMTGTLAFVAFPTLFLYFNNASEAGFLEILSPLLYSLLMGFGLYILSLFITRSYTKSAIITVMISAVLLNFMMIENIILLAFNNLWYWHTIPIILFVTLHICYFVWKKLNDDIADTVSLVILIVSAGLIVFNAVMAAPNIIEKISVQNQTGNDVTQLSEDGISPSEDMPNIYVLIYDEFASFNQMEKYYDYDNVMLKEFFEENNFTNSYNSYNEYAGTSITMTNFINLDYIVDTDTSDAEKEVLRHNGELFSLLSSYGYEIRKYTTMGYYGEDYLGVNTASSTTISGETLTDLFLNQTVLYYFTNSTNLNSVADEVELVKYLSQPENLPEKNTFVLMHVNLPHEPFFYDENGNEISRSYATDWENKEIYKGQYIYSSKLLMAQLENITKNDPTAMILAMSDHGARALNANTFTIESEDKKNILNAFYYNGEDLSEIIDKSSVNTLRLILNEVIDTDFDEVEVPIFK